MSIYSIKFIGRNAYISNAEGQSVPILSIDFKSVIAGSKNGTTLDIDSDQPIIVITEHQQIKVSPEDTLFFSVDDHGTK